VPTLRVTGRALTARLVYYDWPAKVHTMQRWPPVELHGPHVVFPYAQDLEFSLGVNLDAELADKDSECEVKILALDRDEDSEEQLSPYFCRSLVLRQVAEHYCRIGLAFTRWSLLDKSTEELTEFTAQVFEDWGNVWVEQTISIM
jgi:hypothetical protein